MSTKTEKTVKALSPEELSEMLEKISLSQEEILAKQDLSAKRMGSMEERLSKVEGSNTEKRLEDAIEAAAAAKPGMLSKFRQASTGKKAVIATAATAAVAGAAYAGYKGYEYYQERKAQGLPLVAVEAVPTVSPVKIDAVRQGLGSK